MLVKLENGLRSFNMYTYVQLRCLQKTVKIEILARPFIVQKMNRQSIISPFTNTYPCIHTHHFPDKREPYPSNRQ